MSVSSKTVFNVAEKRRKTTCYTISVYRCRWVFFFLHFPPRSPNTSPSQHRYTHKSDETCILFGFNDLLVPRDSFQCVHLLYTYLRVCVCVYTVQCVLLQCGRPIISRIKHFEQCTMTKQTFLDKSYGLIFLQPTPPITPTPLARSVTVSSLSLVLSFFFSLSRSHVKSIRIPVVGTLRRTLYYIMQNVSPCLSVIFYLIMLLLVQVNSFSRITYFHYKYLNNYLKVLTFVQKAMVHGSRYCRVVLYVDNSIIYLYLN